jgi:hypothetical protein
MRPPETEKPAMAPALFMVKVIRGREKLLVVFVFLAGFHAFFYVVDSGINGLDGRRTMSAFIMLGFFKMVLGLLQGFKRSLHVRLIVVIIACDGSDGNAKQTQNDC